MYIYVYIYIYVYVCVCVCVSECMHIYETSLFLFIDALMASNRGDEALAIWKSDSKRGLRVRQRTLIRLMAAASEPVHAKLDPTLVRI